MTRSMLIAAGISLAAFLWVLTGVFLPSTPSPVGEAEAPVARPPAVRVIPSSASPRIGSLVIKGRTQAFRNVPVRAETTGKVVALGEAKGGPIKEGGLILRLSTDDRKAKLDEASTKSSTTRASSWRRNPSPPKSGCPKPWPNCKPPSRPCPWRA